MSQTEHITHVAMAKKPLGVNRGGHSPGLQILNHEKDSHGNFMTDSIGHNELAVGQSQQYHFGVGEFTTHSRFPISVVGSKNVLSGG